jgi:4-amino-4-deoxy-L-arabinose transferase-like glycosyltransferase
MSLNNTNNFKLTSGNILVILIVLSGVIKILFVSNYINLNDINYFEYGELAQNLFDGNGYSMRHSSDWNEIDKSLSGKIYKSAYMSPGYVFFIYPFFYIQNESARSFLVILSQILISCFLLILLYRFTKRNFSKISAFITVIIAGLLPEFVYAATHIQVTIFYQLGIVAVLTHLYKLNENEVRIKSIIYTGIILGLLIILRAEVIMFFAIIVFYLIKIKRFKESLILTIVVLIFLLPWQIRNFSTFNEVVPFTTSGGVNLYRGHNPYAVGVWGDSTVFNRISSFRNEDNFEVLANNFYLKSAINSIIENPIDEASYTFIKLFNLWILSPNDNRTYNIYYLIPWFILLPLFVYGLIKSASWKTHNYSYLFFIFFCAVVVIFFALPRYQTMMKIVLIPFAAYGIENFYMRIKKRGRLN